MTLRNVWIAGHTCGTQTVIQILGTLVSNTVAQALKFILNLRNWILCCIREVTNYCSIGDIHSLVANLQTLLDVWSSLRFLHVSANCVVLRKAWSLSAVGSITTFPEILELTIIILSSANLLYITLGVINSPVGIMVIARACSNLIWTVPLIPGRTHALQIIVRYVGCFLLVIIGHANTIYMLWLSFAHNGSNRLRHIVRTHGWILLTCSTIVLIEIHLIHITDTVLSHLILRRHRHWCILIGSIWRLMHHLHLLIAEVAHFIIMHYKVN